MNIDEAIEAKAYKDGYEQGKKDASTVAYKLSPTEQLTNCQQWILVSERLPEEWTDVLVWSKCGFCVVAVSLGSHGKWRESWTHMMIDDNTITHWMPLPEPPKESQQ